MSRICIVGTGYVGLSYAVALSKFGHEVVGVDLSRDRIEALRVGKAPIYEPGLDELLDEGLKGGRLCFTTSYDDGLRAAEFVFICVGTPALTDGDADLRFVRAAAADIGKRLPNDRRVVIVNKSTMPIGTADVVAQLIRQSAPNDAEFDVVSNPEFLREGSAMADIFKPDRIVLGAGESWAAEALEQLYAPTGATILTTDRRSAELIKYAANAFLATKISFINEVAHISERLGADITTVAYGIGLDPRIGPLFLNAGVGFGGSCFPKDVTALARMADRAGLHPQLLRTVLEINDDQRRRFVDRAERLLDVPLSEACVAIWGLAFKENTDDVRESPAVSIAAMVLERGARVRAYDPKAMDAATTLLPDVEMCSHALAAAEGSDVVMVLTPWNEFLKPDFVRLAAIMRGTLLMDGRNLYEADDVLSAGLRYAGIGRGVTQGRPTTTYSASSDQRPASRSK